LVTFFFARKESYPQPGRRSPLNPQKNPPSQRPSTNDAAIKPQAKETATLHIASQDQHHGPIKPLTCSKVINYDFLSQTGV
jgi:hypothetical protein